METCRLFYIEQVKLSKMRFGLPLSNIAFYTAPPWYFRICQNRIQSKIKFCVHISWTEYVYFDIFVLLKIFSSKYVMDDLKDSSSWNYLNQI